MSPSNSTVACRPVAIDLFAGAGGLSLGFEMAGFDIVSAVEYDPVHAATHLYNFPLTDVLCRDVSRITAEDLLASARAGWENHNPDAGDWDGVVDVIVGGPSCQGFSVMGKRDENDERNKLVNEFVRIVLEVRPRSFVMENVPGILAPQFAGMLTDALERLRGAGYALSDHLTPLDATRFGVPQRRKRIMVLGRLGDVPPPAPRTTTESPVTVLEAFAGLPSLRGRFAADGELFELSGDQVSDYLGADNHYLGTLSRGELGYLAHPRPTSARVLSGCRATEHKDESIARFNNVAQGSTEPVSRAWRLAVSAPSRTLRAGTGRERGAFSASRPLHPTEPRVITVREAARLHSFPDWFRFHTTNWHGHRQIGNAVPPLLARAVGIAIMESLDLDPRSVNRNDVPVGDEGLLSMTPTTAAAYFEANVDEVPRTRLRPARRLHPEAAEAGTLAPA